LLKDSALRLFGPALGRQFVDEKIGMFGQPMKKIWTLGSPSRRTQFLYTGSISTQVALIQPGVPTIDAALFRAALETFRGRRVKGGFNRLASSKGGFGEWVQNESKRLTGRNLTARHASFIAAILCSEGNVKSGLLKGKAVWLEFPR
jgi:hypothetical protein